MDSKPFHQVLQTEANVALVCAIVVRMRQLGIFTPDAAELEPVALARMVVSDDETLAVIGSAIAKSAIASSVARVGEQVAESVGRIATEKVAPAARETGRSVFQATKGMLARLNRKTEGMTCPICGAKAVMRVNRQTGMPFAACSAWGDTGCSWTATFELANSTK